MKTNPNPVGPWQFRSITANTLDAIAAGNAPPHASRERARARERLRVHGGFRPDDLSDAVVLRVWATWRRTGFTDALA